MLVPLTQTEQKIQEMEKLAKSLNDFGTEMDSLMVQIAAGETVQTPDLPDDGNYDLIWEMLAEVAPETEKYMRGFVED